MIQNAPSVKRGRKQSHILSWFAGWQQLYGISVRRGVEFKRLLRWKTPIDKFQVGCREMMRDWRGLMYG
ncbi:hypothetical protein JHK82_053681 [Glycine max]|uniref:Uncharacterized protein n=1 Tax=Glycine soja TaxID=3848 RepID=A0A0B2SKK2_GLYSO|nr:hypothetical protein JHK86_053530 [Glycine max]KAG4916038.1 hypothetical protein JHK87_053595 [Glycine soja]KAG4927990.1 hypothetical protein JHK85_054476 [Glycine max]KAG5083514.1 hypothetical protein JHK84_053552 [Glycine max]KAG5086284.1 hypothetical protein JHK82_053681 [Glycine max]